jgi:hypothetical protein
MRSLRSHPVHGVEYVTGFKILRAHIVAKPLFAPLFSANKTPPPILPVGMRPSPVCGSVALSKSLTPSTAKSCSCANSNS